MHKTVPVKDTNIYVKFKVKVFKATGVTISENVNSQRFPCFSKRAQGD
jgi:hypothetical protein